MVTIIYLEMPISIKAYTECDLLGNYTIVINSRLNYEEERAALQIEWGIILNDCERLTTP